jgi:hypothetical protein
MRRAGGAAPPRLRHTRPVKVTNASRSPSSAQPDSDEYDRLASSSVATCDTFSARPAPPSIESHAPAPGAAHQRRCSAGADTTPTTASSPSSSPINVAHTGTPRTKFLVPSIGSMIQRRRESSAVLPNSSPTTASAGLAAASRSRRACSTARSASVTGVRSGLVSTRRSSAWKRLRVIESATSARASPSARSSSRRAAARPTSSPGRVTAADRTLTT